MNNSRLWKVWEAVYPIGIYFVVTNVVMFLLNLVWPLTKENYVIQQLIATAAVFPSVYAFYRKEDGGKTTTIPKTTAMAVAVTLSGLVMNNLIGFMNWKETSESYREQAENFYGGALFLEIIAYCLLIPLLEELLYRGIVYQRLRAWIGVQRAVIVSAVLFGAMHFNLVQGVYAGCIGILLALCMETGGIRAAILAHMMTNLLSVLRSETGLFDFMNGSLTLQVVWTIAAGAMAFCLVFWLGRKSKE